jgi:hypothetical protein
MKLLLMSSGACFYKLILITTCVFLCKFYIQTHCQKNKKIKRADQILPEVYGTTLNITLILITSSHNAIE